GLYRRSRMQELPCERVCDSIAERPRVSAFSDGQAPACGDLTYTETVWNLTPELSCSFEVTSKGLRARMVGQGRQQETNLERLSGREARGHFSRKTAGRG